MMMCMDCSILQIFFLLMLLFNLPFHFQSELGVFVLICLHRDKATKIAPGMDFAHS